MFGLKWDLKEKSEVREEQSKVRYNESVFDR